MNLEEIDPLAPEEAAAIFPAIDLNSLTDYPYWLFGVDLQGKLWKFTLSYNVTQEWFNVRGAQSFDGQKWSETVDIKGPPMGPYPSWVSAPKGWAPFITHYLPGNLKMSKRLPPE